MRRVVILFMLASRIVLIALAFVLVREFTIRSTAAVDVADLPTTAIVFTGQFDRVELALRLFDQGRLDCLFISGVNGRAGITPRGFADQFRISSNARAALGSNRIILAPDANTTIENALETACWWNKRPDVREIDHWPFTHAPRLMGAGERVGGSRRGPQAQSGQIARA